jgi:glyoxylase-like metal-dependent hydrolase (beta-lactamase superfamily II)
MANRWHELDVGAYALLTGSNVGALVVDGRALMIDTGLDESTVKKVLRELDALEVELSALIITHGHADHFGGAAWLVERANVSVYAPPLEDAFVAHPMLEPLFLYGGAAPIAELQDKFTLAEVVNAPVQPLLPGAQEICSFPLEVIPLPGHAPAQIGIGWKRVLYSGDAVFPTSTLERHPILFCHDLDAWLETLARLPALDYDWFVPGHGKPVQDVAPLAAANAARLEEIRSLVWEALEVPCSSQDVLRAVAAHYGVEFLAPQFFLLSLTTIRAALTSLQRQKEARIVMEENHLRWERT